MAEIFGIVASALSVAGLFNNCVDCFEYVRLGRHFGRDYQTCQLRLDVAKTRLGRWGQAVNINEDSRFAIDSPGDKAVQLARSILEEIMLRFQSAEKTSKRYGPVAEQQDLVLFEDKDMNPVFRGLHDRLNGVARRRQKNTSLVKKAAWALYDAKSFERVVDQIADFVDELEKLFPVETACRRLAEAEVEEVGDEPSLIALRDAADGIDTVLSDVVVQKAEAVMGRNYVRDVKIEDRARLQVGHQFSETVLVRRIAVTDRTTNSVDTVAAKGDARIQIGSRYGGKGHLDG